MTETKSKKGRPKGAKDSVKRVVHREQKRPSKIRTQDFRKAATLEEAVAHIGRVCPKGAIDIAKTIENTKVQWTDLETIALAFIQLAVELLPTVTKSTDALVCADRIMSILEKHATVSQGVRRGLEVSGISLSFSSPEELGIEKKEGE
jgi:hypothetical protein